MNLGQMLLVVLAVVLFSTIILSVYNNLVRQTEMVGEKIYYTQAIKIADLVFQQLEVDILSLKLSIDNLFSTYSTDVFIYGGPVLAPLTIQSVPYTVNIVAQYCNEAGVFSATATNQVKVFCRVVVELNNGNQLVLGEGEDSFSKIFYDIKPDT